MFIAESRAGRRILGRLDRGTDLFEGILTICRSAGVVSAELRGSGALESAEIAEYDQQARVWKPTRRLVEGAELLTLVGSIAEQGGAITLQARATLMRDRDLGVQLLGGHLLAARVFTLEFVLECFDDLALKRGPDAATGLSAWKEASGHAPRTQHPTPAAGTPALTATTWADVAAASAAAPAPSATPDAPEEVDDTLRPGDVLMHQTFGRCEVQRIEGSYEFAHVRLKNGRLVRLSLDVLRVIPAGTEQGKRIFRAGV